MKIKRIMGGLLAGLMVVAIGIGIFRPKTKVEAAAARTVIDVQSYTEGNFSYFLTTYSDYTTTVDVRKVSMWSGSSSKNTAKIYLPKLAYTYEDRDLMRTVEDNSECISFSVYSSTSVGSIIKTITLTPVDIERYNYDPSFIKIGDHIFDPIASNAVYCYQLDLDGNGRVNVLDAQLLLCYVLEVQIGNYESSWNGFVEFREDYWHETSSEI